MTIHFNRHSEKRLRIKLREESTKAEKKLWEYVRDRKILGYKFRRQYSVDCFVMDFYCPEKKLGIELDGEIHMKPEVKNRDEIREGFLRQFGIKLLRIKNEELEDIDLVIHKIKDELTK